MGPEDLKPAPWEKITPQDLIKAHDDAISPFIRACLDDEIEGMETSEALEAEETDAELLGVGGGDYYAAKLNEPSLRLF